MISQFSVREKNSIMNYFLFMGISIAIFSLLLALSKRPNQISDKIFSAFLISLFFPMIVAFAQSGPLAVYFEKYQIVYLDQLGAYMPLTLGPFMLLYVESLTQPHYVLNKNWMLHFSPFLLFSVVSSSFSETSFFSTDHLNPFHSDLPLFTASPWQLGSAVILLLSLIVYSVWIQILLKKHRKNVFDYFAKNPNNISLKWLAWAVYFIFIAFSIPHVIDSMSILGLLPVEPYFMEVNLTLRGVGFVLFIFILSFFGVRQSQVFAEYFDGEDEKDLSDNYYVADEVIDNKVKIEKLINKKELVDKIINDERPDVQFSNEKELGDKVVNSEDRADKVSYEKEFEDIVTNDEELDDKAVENKVSVKNEVIDKAVKREGKINVEQKLKSNSCVISDDQLQHYLEILEDFVKSEKPYQDCELTLGKLAILINMPKHHLTETLNRKLHKNFYSYINEYRLKDIKLLLSDAENSSQTVLTLAYQVGFNSKSTFNSFFKKIMKMTPSQYRKASQAKVT